MLYRAAFCHCSIAPTILHRVLYQVGRSMVILIQQIKGRISIQYHQRVNFWLSIYGRLTLLIYTTAATSSVKEQ